MVFPPIFAYIIFFILDLLALVFYLFVITTPLGTIMTSFTTGLYLLRTLFKYGPQKTAEKLFKYRNIPQKKVIKKIMKVFGSSVIPFLTVWAIHDDYKEEIAELAKAKRDGEEKKKKTETLKKVATTAALVGATVATGGAAAPAAAAAGTRVVAGRAAAGAGARVATGAGARSAGAGATRAATTRGGVASSTGRASATTGTRTSRTADKLDSVRRGLDVAGDISELEDKYRESRDSEISREDDSSKEDIKFSQEEEIGISDRDNTALDISREVGGVVGSYSVPSESVESEDEDIEDEARGVYEETGREINPWMRKTGGEISKRRAKRTVAEEVAGIKTGLRREDYEEDLVDFSKMETYEKLLEERAIEKKVEEQKRQEIEATRLAKRKREELEQRLIYDKAFIRRFGTAAYERMLQERSLREADKIKLRRLKTQKKKEEEKRDNYRENI